MSGRSQPVEVIARALDPEAFTQIGMYRKAQARLSANTILAALKDAGLAVVPRDRDWMTGMMDAARIAMSFTGRVRGPISEEIALAIQKEAGATGQSRRAMLRASQEG